MPVSAPEIRAGYLCGKGSFREGMKPPEEPLEMKDPGASDGAFMECHEEGPPRRRHSRVTNPIGKEARAEVCRTRLGVSDGAVVRTRPRRRDRRRAAVRG